MKTLHLSQTRKRHLKTKIGLKSIKQHNSNLTIILKNKEKFHYRKCKSKILSPNQTTAPSTLTPWSSTHIQETSRLKLSQVTYLSLRVSLSGLQWVRLVVTSPTLLILWAAITKLRAQLQRLLKQTHLHQAANHHQLHFSCQRPISHRLQSLMQSLWTSLHFSQPHLKLRNKLSIHWIAMSLDKYKRIHLVRSHQSKLVNLSQSKHPLGSTLTWTKPSLSRTFLSTESTNAISARIGEIPEFVNLAMLAFTLMVKTKCKLLID